MSAPSKKVLVCVDASKNAFSAFEFYLDNFLNAATEVIILHISDRVEIPLLPPGTSGTMDSVKDTVDRVRKTNEDILEKYEPVCKERKLNYKITFRDSPHNNPGVGIIETAENLNVNSIVVGCRGLGMIRRTVLGSVSDYIIHHSSIPVVVCPNAAK